MSGFFVKVKYKADGDAAVCHNNGHYQSRQVVSICIPFAKYWTLSIK